MAQVASTGGHRHASQRMPVASERKRPGRRSQAWGAASALTIGRCCRQVPMANSTLISANGAPATTPETVPILTTSISPLSWPLVVGLE